MVLAVSVFAQESIRVISTQANLRGTKSNTGLVVTTVSRGEVFELIKEDGAWYLVQTPKYVGWLHGNTIEKYDGSSDIEAAFAKVLQEDPTRPRTTNKPVTTGGPVFQSEYVGIDYTRIRIVNDANLTLTLNFGGVKYSIPRGQERTIEADGGNYEFQASAPGVRPAAGVKNFAKGFAYTWTFFIVTRRG